MMTSLWLLTGFTILGSLLSVEGRPRMFPWEAHPRKASLQDQIRRTTKVNDNNKDMDYFHPSDFKAVDYDDFSDVDDNSDYDYDSNYSGYDGDDEDLVKVNKIHAVARKDSKSSWKLNPHEYLPEEYFGNELHDIDKLSELRQRMEEMQKEMREMQNLLRTVHGR